MQISFIQSGGVAGLSRGCNLDTSTLPRAEAETLAELVRGLEADPPAEAPGPRPGGARPDAASYLIRVEESGRAREYKVSDGRMNEPAAALVRWLSSRAKPRRL